MCVCVCVCVCECVIQILTGSAVLAENKQNPRMANMTMKKSSSRRISMKGGRD